ncbi:MAG TPA: hypothetical protein VFF57_07985 [Hanamia sp.]|nr:hypothetical protein [Hanamia sp.]
MLSLSRLNKIVLQPKEAAVIDENIIVIDEISDEDIRQAEPEIIESLFPFKNRQEMIDEAARLGKFFKDRTLPETYISGIKDLRKFVDNTFEKMHTFYTNDLYLKDRIIDLQSIERKVK